MAKEHDLGFATRQCDLPSTEPFDEVDHPATLPHCGACASPDQTFGRHRKSLESRRRGDQLLIDFLCAAFGGPVFYAGLDMKTSHQGLGITNEEWGIALGHIGATLDALGVAAREKGEVLAAAESLKGDIVEG